MDRFFPIKDPTTIRTFAKKFYDEKIDDDIIETLTEQDLKDFGVDAKGDRLRILNRIRKTNKTVRRKELAADPATSNRRKERLDKEGNFRNKLTDFIDKEIEPLHRYAAAKLVSYATELFISFFKDLKDLKNLEMDVVSRGIIEITEERFFGDRRSAKLKNLSHEERMTHVLAMDHPEVREMKRKIADDDELTEELFPQYSVIAHDYFSSRLYIFITKKNGILVISTMTGVFPGRYKALRALKLLFLSVSSPTKNGPKKISRVKSVDKRHINSISHQFSGQTSQQFSGLTLHEGESQGRVNKHIWFDSDGNIEDGAIKKRMKRNADNSNSSWRNKRFATAQEDLYKGGGERLFP